jgi:hypothetical protein
MKKIDFKDKTLIYACTTCKHWKKGELCIYGLCKLREELKEDKVVVPFDYICSQFMIRPIKEKKYDKTEENQFGDI